MKSTKYPLTAGRKLPWTMDHGRLKVGELLNKTRRRHQKRQQQRGVAVHKQRTAQSIDFKVLVSETPGWRVIFEEQNGGGERMMEKEMGPEGGDRGKRWMKCAGRVMAASQHCRLQSLSTGVKHADSFPRNASVCGNVSAKLCSVCIITPRCFLTVPISSRLPKRYQFRRWPCICSIILFPWWL